jgi:hypothetical protein
MVSHPSHAWNLWLGRGKVRGEERSFLVTKENLMLISLGGGVFLNSMIF